MAGYRVRLRVRMGKAFSTDGPSLRVNVGGHEVEIASQVKGQPLRDATWLIYTTKGFPDEASAQAFGGQLVALVELAAFFSRLGVDIGSNKPTSWINEEFARQHGLVSPEERLAPNIHGLMVLPDDELTRFPLMTMSATVTADANQMLGALAEIGSALPLPLTDLSGPVRLMSAALIEQQHVARLVLAISAVEALGQDESWSASQRDLLKSLALQATSIGSDESSEVAEAILRGTHKIGLRQGVLRLLTRLKLYDLRYEWDRIYGLRSGLVHGTAPMTETDAASLANDAIALCGRVVIEDARQRGLPIAAIVDTHYSIVGTKASHPPPFP